MKTWICILVAAVGVIPFTLHAEDESKGPSSYEKNLVKSRASKFKDTGGKSASGDLYIYVDDKDVDKQLSEIHDTPARERSRTIDIGSPTIKKGDKVRSVNAVVDLKRDIKIDTEKGTTINVANPQVEKGAQAPKEINSLIDVQGIRTK